VSAHRKQRLADAIADGLTRIGAVSLETNVYTKKVDDDDYVLLLYFVCQNLWLNRATLKAATAMAAASPANG